MSDSPLRSLLRAIDGLDIDAMMALFAQQAALTTPFGAEANGVDAVRSRMVAGDSSTQDMDFRFSLDVPVEDEALEFGDMRGRGDSLSTTLSATTVSSASLRTPAPLSAVLPPGVEDAKSHRPPPLIGIDTSSVSSYAQAEALVALACGQVLTAREGDDIPLSARLAALGESLRLERKFKEAEELGGTSVRSRERQCGAAD